MLNRLQYSINTTFIHTRVSKISCNPLYCNICPIAVVWNQTCNIGVVIVVIILVTKSCLTPCDPMDCSPPGSSVLGISQASILEWVAISFSRGSSQPRHWIHISWHGFFTTKPPRKPIISEVCLYGDKCHREK